MITLQLQCINPPSESLLRDIGQLHFGLLDSEILIPKEKRDACRFGKTSNPK